ncbi:MAG: hypothetical protein EA425_08100 [Puniceicoccaceae bacterium]|nr:MAG: hypothetical protein EA425_08100 [Puniceicoccaceae bacterium]
MGRIHAAAGNNPETPTQYQEGIINSRIIQEARRVMTESFGPEVWDHYLQSPHAAGLRWALNPD